MKQQSESDLSPRGSRVLDFREDLYEAGHDMSAESIVRANRELASHFQHNPDDLRLADQQIEKQKRLKEDTAAHPTPPALTLPGFLRRSNRTEKAEWEESILPESLLAGGRLVAIKCLAEHRQQNDEFLERETKTAAALNHRKPTVHQILPHAGKLYLVMEFVEGLNLEEYVLQKGVLTVQEAYSIIRQVAEGLDYLHGKQIVHRDIKPKNLIRNVDGTVKIVDFGIAKNLRLSHEKKLTEPGYAIGTPSYMSPEQATSSLCRPAIRHQVLGAHCTTS